MNTMIKLCVVEGVTLDLYEGGLRVGAQDRFAELPIPQPSLRKPLLALIDGVLEGSLLAAAASAGPAGVMHLYAHLDGLMALNVIQLWIHARGAAMAVLEPIAGGCRYPSTKPADEEWVLSRFAVIRRMARSADPETPPPLLLESPLAHARLALLHPLALTALLQPAAADATMLRVLTHAGFVVPRGSEEVAPLDAWEPKDLWFHSRTRVGGHDSPVGATYRLAGASEPSGPRPPLAGTEHIRLPAAKDAGALADIMSARRSHRAFGDHPMNATQLATLLHRCFRVTRRREATVNARGHQVEMSSTDRPYPSAGGFYELDPYVAVQRCDGVAAGLYRYDGEAHALVPVREWCEDVAALLADAAAATRTSSRPQVLIVLASQFRRIAWSYQSCAYALTLKNVGVVMQSLYLAATELGLGVCAVGSGDIECFAAASGLDPLVEGSVGELLIGSVATAEGAAIGDA